MIGRPPARARRAGRRDRRTARWASRRLPVVARTFSGRVVLAASLVLGCLAVTLPGATPSRADAPRPVAGIAAGKRFALIVAPARLRPGQRVNVRVSDRRGQGGVGAKLCARSATRSVPCRSVTLRAGEAARRLRMTLPAAGRWTISLRSNAGQRIARPAEVRRGARYRVLVSGDSMVYGVIDVLGRSVRASGGRAIGDPNPATGITKPFKLVWTTHARNAARTYKPDATVVFLGAADDFPLTTAPGTTIPCCGADWVAAYAREVRSIMRSYLRAGSGLVYWVLLPEPRDAIRAEAYHAINAAVRRAAAQFPDGVRSVDIGAVISPGGVYTDSITYRGRLQLVRSPDGIHLANRGVHVASDIILRALRADGIAAG